MTLQTMFFDLIKYSMNMKINLNHFIFKGKLSSPSQSVVSFGSDTIKLSDNLDTTIESVNDLPKISVAVRKYLLFMMLVVLSHFDRYSKHNHLGNLF